MEDAASGRRDPSAARKLYPGMHTFRDYVQELFEAPPKPWFHVYMIREEVVYCDYEEGWVRGTAWSMKDTAYVPYRYNTPEMVSRCLPLSAPRMECHIGSANRRLIRTQQAECEELGATTLALPSKSAFSLLTSGPIIYPQYPSCICVSSRSTF